MPKKSRHLNVVTWILSRNKDVPLRYYRRAPQHDSHRRAFADPLAQGVNLPARSDHKIGTRMETESGPGFLRGIAGSENQLQVLLFYTDAVIGNIKAKMNPR